MRRREVIAGLSAVGSAAAWPLRVSAQTERTRRIAVLMSWAAGDPESLVRLAAFRDGLQKLGWREGHNLRLDIRWATSDTGLTQVFRERTGRLAAGHNPVPDNSDDRRAPSAHPRHSHYLRGSF